MPRLHGPRVNLTVGLCSSNVCARFGRAEFPLVWRREKWTSSGGLVLLLSILVSVLLVSTWIYIRRGHRYSGQRPSRSAAYFPSRGRARWVGGRRWALSRHRQSSKSASFYFPFVFFFWKSILLFLKSMVLFLFLLLDMLVDYWEPTPCYHEAYSVGAPKWAFWGKHGQKNRGGGVCGVVCVWEGGTEGEERRGGVVVVVVRTDGLTKIFVDKRQQTHRKNGGRVPVDTAPALYLCTEP